MVKKIFFLQKSHFTSGIPSAKYVYNWFHNSNYCKGGLNGFVHETDWRNLLHWLCIPRGLLLTFIHFIVVPRKWKNK